MKKLKYIQPVTCDVHVDDELLNGPLSPSGGKTTITDPTTGDNQTPTHGGENTPETGGDSDDEGDIGSKYNPWSSWEDFGW